MCSWSAYATVPMRTEAAQAIVVDYDTGNVLFEKNANTRIPTASMSKLLTLYVVFEALENKQIGLEDTFVVSGKARSMEGSRMFLEQGSRVSVDDLIHGVAVQSGNDACVVLAQGLSGTEAAFVEQMNIKALELGMKSSHFANSNGLPNPQHYSTVNDLSVLARAIIRNYPQYYHYFSIKNFTYNNISQDNRNPLLYKEGLGADGVKTGHTQEAGYGLIGSGVDGQTGRRVVIVASGMASKKARASVGARLLEWGLYGFENKQFFTANQEIASARVANGSSGEVALLAKKDIVATLPKTATNIKVDVSFLSPIVAPINKGDDVAKLHIKYNDGQNTKDIEFPLVASKNIKEAGFIKKTLQKIPRLFKK